MTRTQLEADFSCLEKINCQCETCSRVYEAEDDLASRVDYGPDGGYYDTFGDRY